MFLCVVSALIGSLALPACGAGSLTEGKRVSAETAIYAAVTRQLVEFNNTFGPHHRFSHILMVEHLDPDAGNDMRWGQSAGLLSEEQRQAIVAAVEHLGPVRFISSWSEFVQEDKPEPVIPGSVIVTLAPVEFDDQGARVGANLWCGSLCGLWVTYRVMEGTDGWSVAGTEGDWTIS